MNDQVICRICFASDNVKLCSVFSFGLTEAYEKFVGVKVSEQASLPEYICSYCTTLLLKCLSFQVKCQSAYNFMKYSAQINSPIDQLDEASNFKLPYAITNNNSIINIEYIEPQKIKQEFVPIIEFKIENCEPKKKKKKKKKEVIPVKTEDVFSNDDTFDNDNDNVELFNDTLNNDLQIKNDQINDTQNNEVHNNDTQNNDAQFNDAQVNDAQINDAQVNDNDAVNSELVTHELLDDVKIIILTIEEQLQEIEDRKTSSNYLNSSYKCGFCFKGFMMPSTFRNHMLKHDPERGELKCDICKSRFSELRALRAHVVHTHERKYICKLCDHVSRSSHRAKEHAKWHNGYTFSCKICGATFAKSTSHLTHIRLQHPSNNACDICGESFIGEFGLKMHKRKAHSSDSNQTTECAQCDFKFASVEALSRHLELSGNETCHVDMKPCTQCGEEFQSEEVLNDHVKNQHKEEEAAFCHDCKRSFTSTRSYEIHFQRVHLGVKLKQRKRAACKRGESAVCEVCGYRCISNATLMYHQRTHTGEKPYQCTECPKKFSVFQRLQIHLRTHTGETPYQCQHCPKAFKHKAALNRHDRVHTGAKPYSCPHCGKAFSQSNSMKLHVNTVHLKLPAPYRNRRPKIN